MRVLFISHTAHRGGAEIVLERFLRQVGGFRHALLVPPGPFADALVTAGLPPLVATSLGNLRRGENPMWWLRLPWRWLAAQVEIARWLRLLRPDVVQCNNYVTVIYALLPALLCRVPLVWHMHDIVLPGQWVRPLLRPLSRLAGRIIAVSEAVRDNLLGHGVAPDKVVTLYNAVPPADARPPSPDEAARIAAAARWPLTLGVMGTPDRLKGFHVALAALALLVREHGRDAGLLVAGEAVTPQQRAVLAELEAEAQRLGVAERLVLLGQVSATGDFFGAVQRFVHVPVLPDSLPTVVLEAVAAGCPVVGARIGGVPECLGEGRWGVLVPPDDPAALAAALAEPPTPLPPEARAAFHQRFSHETKEQGHLAIYRALTGRT